MRERLKNKKGFTLAELLIVVAIIAILVAIMVPVFGTSRANAIHARDTANVRSLYVEAVSTALAANDYDPTEGYLKVSIKSPLENLAKKEFDSEVSYDKTNSYLVVKTVRANPEQSVIEVDDDVEVDMSESEIIK